jgi:hypothetical protein
MSACSPISDSHGGADIEMLKAILVEPVIEIFDLIAPLSTMLIFCDGAADAL